MNLFQAFTILNIIIPSDDRDCIKHLSDSGVMSLDMTYGEIVRSQCRLLTDGTSHIASDIMNLPEELSVKYLVGLSFDSYFIDDDDKDIREPHNCSYLILCLYRDYLNGKLKQLVKI